MTKKSKKKEPGFWDRVAKISKEVDKMPESKRRLGGLSSNYCSELQPFQGESKKAHRERIKQIMDRDKV